MDLVKGTEIKAPDMFSGKETKGEEIPSNTWAIIALGAAVIGLLIFLIREKRESVIGVMAGTIGFATLLILQFTIKSAILKKAEDTPFELDFQFAYWAALIAFGIAAFLSYLRMQKAQNIIVTLSPPPSASKPIIEDNLEVKSVNNLNQKANNFDIVEWFRKYYKKILGVIFTVFIFYGVYFVFFNQGHQTYGITQFFNNLFAKKESNALFSVRINGKVGFIDNSGKIIINPQFDNANEFSEGLAAISVDKKWGFIDKNGKIVINPQFDGVNDFKEGFATICIGCDYLYGANRISADNKRFERIPVKFGYINKNGKIVITPQFDWAYGFQEGLAQVEIGINGKWGYIDKTGKLVIQPQFYDIEFGQTSDEGFCEGLAATYNGNYWGFIDKKGKTIIDFNYDLAYDFSEGLALVKIDKKFGYIDKSGKFVINPLFDGHPYSGGKFEEGLASVKIGDKEGYINKSGEFVINPQFEMAGAFSEGLAAISVDKKWGFIDKNGKIVIAPQFDSAYDFKNSLAQVEFNKKYGYYIDKKGQFIWSPKE